MSYLMDQYEAVYKRYDELFDDISRLEVEVAELQKELLPKQNRLKRLRDLLLETNRERLQLFEIIQQRESE